MVGTSHSALGGFPVRTVIGFVLIAASFAVVAVKVVPRLAAGAQLTVATAETATVPSRIRPAGGFKVAIPADENGHYFASAVVNGHTIEVVVDTGATSVALTSETARRLGLKLQPADFDIPISTANGVIAAAEVTLSEIRVGSITLRNINAMVVPGDALGVNLLGMTFLNRLTKFEVAGGQLLLVD